MAERVFNVLFPYVGIAPASEAAQAADAVGCGAGRALGPSPAMAVP
jgi:hypothetical protein